MSEELRNSLWSVLDSSVWQVHGFTYELNGNPVILEFAEALWFGFFKEPIDEIPGSPSDILRTIRNYFFKCTWFEVYDFLEGSCLGNFSKFPASPYEI
jgi:hypothetical protein